MSKPDEHKESKDPVAQQQGQAQPQEAVLDRSRSQLPSRMIRSVLTLSPPKVNPLRRSLSPLSSSVSGLTRMTSSSISKVARPVIGSIPNPLPSISRPAEESAGSSPGTPGTPGAPGNPGSAAQAQQAQDKDCATAIGLAKSFVSLLTTASMYSGNLGNIVDADEEDEEDGQDETLADKVGLKGLKDKLEGAEHLIEEKVEPAAHRHRDESELSQYDIDELHKDGIDVPQSEANRKQSLFEISVANKFKDLNLDEEVTQTDERHRAFALSSKLISVFNIQPDDEFIGRFPCWLLKDVLIQGHVYLTKSHLLYFAYLPVRIKNKVTISGNLRLDTFGPKSVKNWAVLKNYTLSLYSSSTDLYFPNFTVDLRSALRVESLKDCWFRILCENKNYKFQADSEHSARSWIALIRKHIFTIRNKGDTVTIKIPLQNILDVENSEIIEGSNTCKVKVLESPETFAVDDYFFMFFRNGQEAVDTINESVKNWKAEKPAQPESIEDSTMISTILQPTNHPVAEQRRRSIMKKVFARSRRSSSNHSEIPTIPENEPVQIQPKDSALEDEESSSTSSPTTDEHYRKRSQTIAAIPQEVEHQEGEEGDQDDSEKESEEEQQDVSEDSELSDELLDELKHTSSEHAETGKLSSDTLSANTASSLTRRHRLSFSASALAAKSTVGRWTPKVIKSASYMWYSNPIHYEDAISIERGVEDDPYLAPLEERKAATKRFQDHFSFPPNHILVSAYYCYLQRNIPTYGKIYLSDNEICFRSLVPGFSTTMVLPLKDVENCYKEKGFKFGYSGLVIVIHGHEELFFEFNSENSRDDCEFLILKQLDLYNKAKKKLMSSTNSSTTSLTPSVKLEVAKIKLIEDKIHSTSGLDIPIMIEDNPFIKTNIKPGSPLLFTLLTIGSRGDVQPYIALGLGLVKEGHKVRIVTHEEFREWCEGYGFEFRAIAGNPAELMSLMVEHGSMNVGLIKEASGKFRGWIRDLLTTSWEACQGSQVIIESPSAMAGIHIAEALDIPYFRAFTMPWTRTRAYPHAFIVPDQKRGGSYNYLTYVLFENIFWKGTSGQINKWRKEVLHLPKTNLETLQQNKVPFLYNVSPQVVPPPVDYSNWIKVTGYWFLNESTKYDPPKELVEFMERARKDNKKLVYIGFGSIVVTNPKELTQAVVDAVLDADVRCILNKGWSERSGGSKKVEIELPYEVFNAGSLPHDWLFPQIDAAVHHGGSGTTGATLRAGLPTIIKPFFGDQFFYANRVEDIGVGVALKKLNVKSLSKALKEVTTNNRMIQKAKDIGELISKEDGVGNAILAIYTEMDYAASLIHEKHNHDLKEKSTIKKMLNIDEIEEKSLDDDSSWLVV